MALDSNGQPMFVYLVDNPDDVSGSSMASLYFVKWDDAACAFTSPLVLGSYLHYHGIFQLASLSLDPMKGDIVVAYAAMEPGTRSSSRFMMTPPRARLVKPLPSTRSRAATR